MWGVSRPRLHATLSAPQGSAVTVLKFVIVFEQGVPHSHFAASSADSIAGPPDGLDPLLAPHGGLGVHPDGKVKS